MLSGITESGRMSVYAAEYSFKAVSGSDSSAVSPVEAPNSVERKDSYTPSKNAVKAQKSSQKDEELSDDEKKQVQELEKRDAEVKAHEAAHMAAGGGLVRGGASYSYQQGPNGKRYAVGGEVSIDSSSANTPEATIAKMQAVRSAAMAPASPSSQDRSVAAAASQKEAAARQQLAEKSSEDSSDSDIKSDEKSDDISNASKLADKFTQGINSTGQNFSISA